MKNDWIDKFNYKSPAACAVPAESAETISQCQKESIAIGLQPKWSPKFQLIPDGLEDPLVHVGKAMQLEHPAFLDPPFVTSKPCLSRTAVRETQGCS